MRARRKAMILERSDPAQESARLAGSLAATLYSCASSERQALTTKKLQERDGDGQYVAPGRLLALDLGTRRVGVAVSDEMRLTVRPLPAISRGSWKKLVANVSQIVREFDAKELVLGLPLRLDGTQGDAAREVRRLARNFELTLKCPVHLQDERLTTRAAEEALRDEQVSDAERAGRLDSEAAAIILRDFISSQPAQEINVATSNVNDSSTSAELKSSSHETL
jgi:putative Holliday junction resolvase